MITSLHQRVTGLAAVIVFPAVMCSAQNWVGGTSQDWNTLSNWSSGSNTGNVSVNVATGNFPIISATTPNVNDISVGSLNSSSVGRVDHRAGSRTGTGWMFLGINGGAGTYNLADTSAAGTGLTGFAQGTGSFSTGARLYVGRNGGSGTLNIHTTGSMTTGLFIVGTGSSGQVNIESGSVTTFEVFIGGNENASNLPAFGGTGSISMSGGTLTATNRSFIGDGAASTGTMTMTGGTWNQNHTGVLFIGLRDGNGSLVMSGTSVLNDQSVVDTSTSSTNKGNVHIGLTGTGSSSGSLSLGDSAVARVRYLGVAEAANTTGLLNISGSASLTLSNQLTIGQRGAGTANLNGGTITLNSNHVYIGGFVGGDGTLNVNGGTLRSAVAGVMRVHVAYSGTGSMTVNGGILEGLNSLQVAVLAGSSGTVQLNGGVVQAGGFTIGAGTANVNFNGGTVQATVNNTNYFSGLTASNSEIQAGGLTFDSNGRTVTASNSFDGGGGITKTGGGTLILSNVNTYSGTTTVSAGALQVGVGGTGTSGTGAVAVQSGGTILGTGTVSGSSFTAASGSTTHAGDSTASGSYGTLTFTSASGSGSLDFQPGSSTILGIQSGGPSDILNFVGTGSNTLSFNGNLTISASLSPISPEVFNLLDWAGLASAPTFDSRYNAGSYSGYLLGNGDDNLGFDLPDVSSSGFVWDISNFTTNGSIALVVVPEPSRVGLLMLSLGAILMRCNRKERRGSSLSYLIETNQFMQP